MSDKFKLDIFDLLKKINSGDLHIWEKLTEEERKSISPYIVSQWMFGTSNQVQIIFLNELVNPFIWSFSKHPHLLLKLMACCGTGSFQKFTWIPFTKKKKEASLSTKVLQEYYNYSEKTARQQLHLLTFEDILEMAEELGWQKDELTKLKKEK